MGGAAWVIICTWAEWHFSIRNYPECKHITFSEYYLIMYIKHLNHFSINTFIWKSRFLTSLEKQNLGNTGPKFLQHFYFWIYLFMLTTGSEVWFCSPWWKRSLDWVLGYLDNNGKSTKNIRQGKAEGGYGRYLMYNKRSSLNIEWVHAEVGRTWNCKDRQGSDCELDSLSFWDRIIRS